MKFIRKPKPIEAMKWDGTDRGRTEIEAHFLDLETAHVHFTATGRLTAWDIKTANGSKNVFPGRYVYKNEAGRFWTMRPEDLEAEYDEVIE